MRAGQQTHTCAVWIAALISLVAPTGPTQAQRIMGSVMEDGSRAPIADARVVLIEPEGAARATAFTDPTGGFGFAVPAGGYAVHVDRIGYEPYTSPVLGVGDGEAVSIEIRLGVGALPLEPLIVTARSTAARGRSAEFHERRTNPGRAGGFFLTREDMERGVGGRTTDVLARVPVIVLRPTAPRGAPPEQAIGRYMVQLRGSGGGTTTGSCSPAIYVDGVRFRQSDATLVDDFTDPARLEGVEVYARASFAPPEYAAGNDCGVLLFWTRPAEAGSDWGWKRVAAGMAGLSLIFALMMR